MRILICLLKNSDILMINVFETTIRYYLAVQNDSSIFRTVQDRGKNTVFFILDIIEIRCIPVGIDHGLRRHGIIIDLHYIAERIDLAHLTVISHGVFCDVN